MKIHLPIISLIALIAFSACKTGPGKNALSSGYNFTHPDATFVLPAILKEISGLVCVDSVTLACVQDEQGIIFLYDLTQKKVNRQIEFFSNGDYEGIARVNDTIYVLRSDGTLFEISDYRSDSATVKPYPTDIPSKDNEGLCYDGQNNRLLIACKEITGKGELSKDKRYVFAFDLNLKTMPVEPIYSYELKQIREFAANNGIDLPIRIKKKGVTTGPVLKFQTSGIAIHPLTNELYLLSAEDYLLLVFDRNGNIDQMIRLNTGLFNQPEGITFMENGDMYVSNEGAGKGPGTLRRLNYHTGYP